MTAGETASQALSTLLEGLSWFRGTMTASRKTKPVESLPELLPPFYGERNILQGFGANAEVYKRFGFEGHMGLDYACPEATPVLASHDGIVDFAGDGGEWPTMGSAAGTCILLKGKGFRTGYAHLSRLYVATGTQVKAGDVIGLSGHTGATTGPHLHFEVLPMPLSFKNGYAGRTDPTPYLPKEVPPPLITEDPAPVEGPAIEGGTL